jgi:hypothetical protein
MSKRQTKFWYARSRQAIKRRYGKDWKLAAGLLAAVSANNTVKSTVSLADKAYWQIKTSGTIRRESFCYAHYKSILGVLKEGKPHGRKCQALYYNLIGDENYVPVDIWLLRYFRIYKERPSKPQFDLIEQAIKEDAYAKGLTVAQRQAEIWCEARGKTDDFSDHLAQLKLL